MMRTWIVLVALLGVVLWAVTYPRRADTEGPRDRQQVLFWHFWGGEERAVVAEIVRRFNTSQSQYWVREVAMPGANLDVKLFLAVTGGAPPDVVNQDDPILADWAMRGAIQPLSAVATANEIDELHRWLFPAAWQLGTVQGIPFALCNGLDIRALYYNATVLDEHHLTVPQSIAELDHVAQQLVQLAPPGAATASMPYQRLGFLPNPRNLWSWGIVFGGDFFDEQRLQPTPDDPAIVEALDWMASYGRKFGPTAAAFRQRDQSLPGKPFPLLTGRYAMMEDGQWRVRDLARAVAWDSVPSFPKYSWSVGSTARDRVPSYGSVKYGVAALPRPPGGLRDAGWINGNFFVIPRGARNTQGAWEFMKFWSGFGGHESEAARSCAEGFWIPVSQVVVDEPVFQAFLQRHPLFSEFVRLAASANQVPRPNVPSAMFYDREIQQAAAEAIFRGDDRDSAELLATVRQRMEQQLRLQQSTWERFLTRLSAQHVATEELSR